MTIDKSDKFSKALDRLVNQGDMLRMAMDYECYPDSFIESVKDQFGEDSAEKFINKLPNFREDYQVWYSEAQALVRQTLPNRLEDFKEYYEYPRVRKDISFGNYRIKDYLQGLQVSRPGGEIIVNRSAARPEFEQQLNIVKAARKNLDSVIIELTSILQADLFDSEVDSARALAKAGFLRASGAVCGVVIEKHLQQICKNHLITVKKKNPGVSDLSQLLKDADVITLPQWRFVQHLADIRNLCDHSKGREPTKDEIDDLLGGTEKVLKTVF